MSPPPNAATLALDFRGIPPELRPALALVQAELERLSTRR